MKNAVVHAVSAGAILFDQGEMPVFQHVVLSGSVHLLGRSSSGDEVLIDVIEPPNLVAPAAVVTASPYLMRARAPTASRLLLIHAGEFRRVVSQDLPLSQEVIGSLAGQFRRMVRQIKNLKLRAARERVGCYLLDLARRQGTADRAVLPYEKSLIASELGMTRESFSRALAALQADGVAVKGDVITIANPEKFAMAVERDPLIDFPEELAPTGADGRKRRKK